jgi:hypothetical protein
MRRPFTYFTSALACALVSTVLVAQQQPPAQQPPTQPPPTQPATQQPPAAAAPAAPKLPFTTPAGMLLIQIKPDQTAAFEELMAKIKAGVAKSTDATIKQQMTGFKVYKATEQMNNNALYVVTVDPAVKDVEYEFFAILQKVLTPDELRDPAVIEMSKKAAAAFAVGYNKLSLTPLGGM